MLNPVTIVLMIIAIFIIICLFIEFMQHKKDGKVILQSEISKLEVDQVYTIVFKKSIFSKTSSLTITTKQHHLSLMTKNTLYSGRTDIYIQVSTNNVTVYSAYLRNVIDFFLEESQD